MDEEFWYQIKMAYTVSPTVLNLNNGGVSPQPKVVQNAVERYNQLSNEAPSYYMWRILDMGREPLRAKLAELAGCSKEEIAIDRYNPKVIKAYYFSSNDITIFVNILSGEVSHWRLGQASH